MAKKSYREIHAKLVKIAQDELAIANNEVAPNGEAGPQEVVDELVEVIDDLEKVVDVIPAEPSSDAAEEIAAEPPENGEDPAAAIPPSPEEEKLAKIVKIAAEDLNPQDGTKGSDKDDDEDKKKDAKITNLTKQVTSLTQHVAKEELAKVAKEYAEALHNDTRTQQAKYDEIMKGGKPSSYWEARLDAIEEYSQTNNVSNEFSKPAKNFSSYRVAKLNRTPERDVNL